MNHCIVCGKDCKNKFCSISCRNIHWNPKLKTGISVDNSIHVKPRIEYKLNCITCGKEFVQLLTTSQIANPSKHRITCSVACGKSHKHSEETNEKIRQSVINSNIKKGIIKKINWKCFTCGVNFIRKHKTKYCSKDCAKKSKRKNSQGLQIYRFDCKFKFNPYNYPEILDISLLQKYGFYSPSNKKNNLNGVSMDHKLSIVEGFTNKIDPYYMSHIMNCELMIHNNNIGKGSKSTITFEHLKKLVDEYDLNMGLKL